MKDISRLQSEEFETLLRWLSEDRERAGAEYLKIREGLVRFFYYKGCSDAQTLADETINRVAVKISTLDESKNAKKITVFYGFAVNVFREYLRNNRVRNEKLNRFSKEQRTTGEESDDSENDARISCLNECMATLKAEDREVFLEYYGQSNEKKSEARKKIAERLQCELNTLQVRIFRLRSTLARCIENCMKKKL